MSVADIRRNYKKGELREADAPASPFVLFKQWFDASVADELLEVNAMTVATVGDDGRPSARIVLLKGFDERGFVFYTNYLSRKGIELAHVPYASAVFLWAPQERQVRIEGRIEKVSTQESDAYFHSRPLGSRIGAWASDQSAEIPDHDYLVAREAEYRERFGDDPPRPPHWGGYRIVPDDIEFWQGRPSRLHDRLSYRRGEDGTWRIARLAP